MPSMTDRLKQWLFTPTKTVSVTATAATVATPDVGFVAPPGGIAVRIEPVVEEKKTSVFGSFHQSFNQLMAEIKTSSPDKQAVVDNMQREFARLTEAPATDEAKFMALVEAISSHDNLFLTSLNECRLSSSKPWFLLVGGIDSGLTALDSFRRALVDHLRQIDTAQSRSLLLRLTGSAEAKPMSPRACSRIC